MVFKRQKLTPRVVQDLKKRSTIGIVFYMIAVSVVLVADGYYLRYPVFSKQFFVLVIGICLFRLIHGWAEPWIPAKFDRAGLCIFIGSIALTGLIWGLGFAAFMGQKGELNIQLLMVVCTLGLCSGAMVAFLPSLWLGIAYIFCIMGPSIAILLADLNLSLSILFVIYVIYMVFIVIRGNNEYWTALENEALLEQKSKDLEKISQRDGLTGLYNRRYFETAFDLVWKQARRNQTRIDMVICDIDEFKQVNDTFGHLAGDEYLKMIAKILEQVFQRESDIVARYGGDEFVVLLPEESSENVATLAEKIRKKVAETPLVFELHTISTTVSLGVATITPQPSVEKDSMIAIADTALYAAKKKGRNQVSIYGS